MKISLKFLSFQHTRCDKDLHQSHVFLKTKYEFFEDAFNLPRTFQDQG